MTTQISITIDLDNAAFEQAGGSEVARILRALATRYDEEGLHIFEKLQDVNGNVVGEVELCEVPNDDRDQMGNLTGNGYTVA